MICCVKLIINGIYHLVLFVKNAGWGSTCTLPWEGFIAIESSVCDGSHWLICNPASSTEVASPPPAMGLAFIPPMLSGIGSSRRAHSPRAVYQVSRSPSPVPCLIKFSNSLVHAGRRTTSQIVLVRNNACKGFLLPGSASSWAGTTSPPSADNSLSLSAIGNT